MVAPTVTFADDAGVTAIELSVAAGGVVVGGVVAGGVVVGLVVGGVVVGAVVVGGLLVVGGVVVLAPVQADSTNNDKTAARTARLRNLNRVGALK